MSSEIYQPGGVDLDASALLEKLRRRRRQLVAWLRKRCGTEVFKFNGGRYRYAIHCYNQTWSNERCVEIPIARMWLKQNSCSGPILEVGNVLSHYQRITHNVLDKYESNLDQVIIREDFLRYQPHLPLARLISISTFEHIGRDEEAGEPELAIRALHKVPTILAAKGKALITFAAGYNTALDSEALHLAACRGWTVHCLKRTGECRWVECEIKSIVDAKYGSPYSCGNMLVVLSYTHEHDSGQQCAYIGR